MTDKTVLKEIPSIYIAYLASENDSWSHISLLAHGSLDDCSIALDSAMLHNEGKARMIKVHDDFSAFDLNNIIASKGAPAYILEAVGGSIEFQECENELQQEFC